MTQELQQYLESCLTEERKGRLHEVLAQRTRFITVVLEDLSNPLNANACIRTLDCFGLQDLHVIENKHLFERDFRTSKGTVKWVDVHKHTAKPNNTFECLNNLKSKGYVIVSLSPHATKTVYELDFNRKIAFVFGNESDGVSREVTENTDEFVKLPMYGFAESFNISVSVAMTLQNARYQMEKNGGDWQLKPQEQEDIYKDWLTKAVNHSELLIDRFENKG